MRSARWLVVAVLVAALCAMAGCGGDDEVSKAADDAPWATGIRHDRLAERIGDWMAQAKTKRDCDELGKVSARSQYWFKCPLPAKVRQSMARFEVLDSAVFGSAALIGYRTGKLDDGAVMLMHVAPDRRWAVTRSSLLYEPDPDTSDEDSRPGFDAAVDGYLRAVRRRDCDLYFEYYVTFGPTGKAACKQALDETKQFAEALKASPRAQPQYMGGNSDFGFYALLTLKPNPRYVTISVVRTAEGAAQPYVVLSAAPGPPTRWK